MMNGFTNGIIPATGLTVLFDPGVSASLDDNGGEESAEPPSKVRKFNPFSNSRREKGNSSTPVYWPRDLLPKTIPYARVLTHGYDTHLRHVLDRPLNRATVYDIAWDFLVALEAERRHEPSRPILFVAHSLGGIIVKEMLRRSNSCQAYQSHFHNVFSSTIGIVFFGTPHGGADPRGFLRDVAETLFRAAGFSVNDQIVNTLLPSSERLRELRDEFGPIAHEQNWMIHSFQEESGIKYLNGRKVVEDTSSYLNFPRIETTQHIGRNHMDMCRFTGLDDIEYKKVAAVLDRITRTVCGKPKTTKTNSLSDDQRRMLIESLRFDQMDARQMSVKTALGKTCKWLLKRPEYLDWLDMKKVGQHYGFLWIKGKPGTGKSTLMKFALRNSQKMMKDQLIISFFFNARGASLEKSTTGMYRSLLLQLLERLPELQSIFESVGFTPWNTSSNHTWSIVLLKDLFERAVQLLGQASVICFIDALDECDEDQIRDMVAFFQRLGDFAISSEVRFRVLFTSRHYPHITITKGLSLVLEGQEGHSQDITTYVNSELKINKINLAGQAQIRRELEEKSSGVFMWVVLVVGILNKEHDQGRTAKRLRRKLSEIPGDLHELFHDLLTRDCHNQSELLLCIQWVLFAREPLKPEELYFAVLSGTEREDLSKWNPDEVSMSRIKTFILNSSKGLAEITKSKIPTVQFIHESVRDFLLKENGLRTVWANLGGNLQGESHERLAHCCLEYISAGGNFDIESPLRERSTKEATVLRQQVGTSFPFLGYAVENILHHAEAADVGGVSQKDFILNFPLPKWLKLHNLFEKFDIRRHSLEASLLYILAGYNMPALIRALPYNGSCFEVESERYGPPILAGMAMQSFEAVRALLEVQAAAQPPTSALRGLAKYCEHIDRDNNFTREFKFSRQKSAFSHAAEYGSESLMALFLLVSIEDIESKDKQGRTPLSWAAENKNAAVIKTLLATGQVDIESKDKQGRTPLSWAAEKGNEAVVKTLLATGQVDVGTKSNSGWTPLGWAARNGHEDVVKILLATGQVDVDTKDTKYGQTPLSWAAEKGHEAVVKTLLATGQVDVDTKSNSGWTPLGWAARSGYEDVVKILLATGQVDVDSKDNSGRTPLICAVQKGHEATVKILLATGRVDVDAKDNSGWTPLMCAVQKGHEATVKILLATGQADVDTRDIIFGRTPLGWAAANGHEAVVKTLLATGQVDVDTKDNGRWTPLSLAADKRQEAIAKILLATGQVDVDIRDIIFGRTPLS
ncbi:hypothetical protein DL771_006638 [Monosporascus sp. 5C6A]|nr:hypothetical protein DL771_006638 [Monosporascus sp. 5C6A]